MTTTHEWRGWHHNNGLLYLDQPTGSDYVGLYLQMDHVTEQVAVFRDGESAQCVQEWLDVALGDLGRANAELTMLLDQARRDG